MDRLLQIFLLLMRYYLPDGNCGAAGNMPEHHRTFKRNAIIFYAGMITLLLTMQGLPSFAQQIEAGTGAPALDFEVANGSRTFTVTVLGGTTPTGSLTVTLPAGYIYLGGSSAPSGGLGVSETTLAGNVATLALTGIPATGTNATFTFKAIATCAAIGGAGNQASYVLTPTAGAAQPAKLSNAFNLRNAKINITNLANAPATAGVVGDSYVRTYRINNNGFGNIDTVYVSDVSGTGVTHVGQSVSTTNLGETVTVSLLSSTTVGTNTTYLYRFIISSTAQDNHLGQNEYFTFTQNLQIASCANVNTSLNAFYGVGPNNVQPCTGQNDTQTTALSIDNSKQPVLTFTSITANYPICRGNNVLQEFKVVNTGTAAAKDILLRLFHMYATGSVEMPLGMLGANKFRQVGYVAGSFKYKIGAAGSYVSIPVNAASGITLNNEKYFTVASCLNNTSPSDLDLIVPDLAVGEEIYFQYEETNCCNQECTTTVSESPVLGSSVRYRFKNTCGSEITNTLASGKATNLRNYVVEGMDVTEIFPTDIIAGTPYTLKFETTNAPMSPVLYPVGSTVHYQITLPVGLVYGAPNTISYKTGGGVVFSPTSVVQTGQVLDIIFTTTAAFSFPKGVLSIQNVTLDCSVSPVSPGVVDSKVFVRSAGCTTCEQQLFCGSQSIAFHCVIPCPQPAMINNNFGVARVNFGQPDNNNDGQPDGASLSTNVRTNWVSRGDQLVFTFNGTVKDDGATPVDFKFGYAKFSFPASAGAHITGVSADVLITDATGTITKVNKTGLPLSFTGSGATGIVDYSIDKLAVAGYNSFVNGDKVTIKAYLKVTNGLGNSIFVTAPVATRFYLSNAANPNATTGDVWDCDNFSGEFTLVGMGSTAGNQSTISANECATVTSSSNATFFVGIGGNNGGAGSNLYKEEYRQFAVADNMYYTLPAGYSLDQVNIGYTRTVAGYTPGAINIAAVTADAVSGNVYRFNVRKFFADQPGGTWPLPDEGFSLYLTAVLRPTCEAPVSTTDLMRVELVPGPVFAETLPPGPNSNVLFTPQVANTINLTKSNIVVNAATPVVTVTGNTVTWEVQVANTQPGTSPKIWMGENTTPTNGITIQSVQQITAYGGTTVGSPLALTGDMYQLGTYGQESRYYRVTATFTNCGQDVIPLAVGYVCGAYPASIDAALCKNITNLTVIPTAADLAVSLIGQPVATYPDGTVDLCQELEYTAEVKNPAQGTAYDLKFVVNKPVGVAYIANSYQLSPTILPTAATFSAVSNDATYVSETATTITFTIPASAVANLPYNQGYTIRYKVKTLACDFVSGTKMRLQATGTNGCGSVINGTQQQSQSVRIHGENTNPNGYTVTSSVSAPIDGCSPAGITYTFAAKNDGPVATYGGESIRVTIPKPFTLGTVTGVSNFTSGAVATVTSDATTTTYVWTMPVGVAVNQSVSFSAPLSATAGEIAALSCAALPIHELVAYTFEATCVPSGPSCSGTLQAEGEHDGTVITISKPALSITGFTAGTPNATNIVEGTMTVSNTNGVMTGLPQAATITVYHDSNNNGIIDAGDVTIGTKSVTITTTTPQVFNYSMTTTYQGNLCPVLVSLGTVCACTNPIVYQYACNIPLPVKLESFDVTNSESGVLLNWATTSETNSDRFEIEHSIDATNWYGIGSVKAAGESKLSNKYSFTDASPVNGLNYYRLKMVDQDGSFAYSRIKSIRTSTGNGVTVYPNPVTESITLGTVDISTIGSVEIFDAKGVVVMKTAKPASNKINVEKLGAGIYVMKITRTSGVSESQKIVKK